MRTTLSLDDDVLLAVQERARREKRTVGQVLSDLARQALTGSSVRPTTTGATITGSGLCRAEVLPSPTP